MVATSAQNEADESVDGLDAAFDVKDIAFLYGLTRDESEHGLFKSKREIEDNRIPNKPGYDQLIYAACLYHGNIIAVIGAGRKFQPGGKRHSWKESHLTSVRAVADMLESSFVQVKGLSPEDKSEFDSDAISNFLTEQCTMEEQSKEVSSILGDVCKRCSNHGLLGISMWEYENDSSWFLYPGRRTRESIIDEFVEKSDDSCEVLKTDPLGMYLLARVDTMAVFPAGDDAEKQEAEKESLLEDWVRFGRAQATSSSSQSLLTREIGVLMDTNEKAVNIEGIKHPWSRRRHQNSVV